MQPVVIIGGSGFIGRSLLKLYNNNERSSLKVLLRNVESLNDIDLSGINVILGDLTLEKSLDALIMPRAIVINLAFLENSDKSANLKAINNLIKKCKSVGIKRFLHCSTSSVYGSVKEVEIDEETPCNPKSDYEVTKFEIENLLRKESCNNFELIIVRPTCVFGQEGKNLIKFIDAVKTGNPILNYFRACLFYKRRMNLVPVETVSSSIKYLSELINLNKEEIFIVSADDEEINNFHDVEIYIREFLNVRNYIIPIFPLPLMFLKIVLWIRGRSNILPNTIYSNEKLYNTGFVKKNNFVEKLREFVSNQ